MTALRDFISSTPVPICGLALGIASLSSFLSETFGPEVRLFALFSAFFVILFTCRVIIDPKGVSNDLQNPAVFGVLPTYTMTLMILSSFIYGYSEVISLVIWWSAVLLSFVIMVLFVRRFVLGFTINNVFPSWFVIFVGYVVAATTAPAVGMEPVGRVLFCTGFAAYVILLPILTYRTVVVRNIPTPAIPNIAIFTAPINLCIVGYMASFETYNETLLIAMAVVGVASYAAVLAYMPCMLRNGFMPSYAAFTFPLVISAISFRRLASYFAVQDGSIVDILVDVTLVIAIIVVAYVLIRFLMLLAKNASDARTSGTA